MVLSQLQECRTKKHSDRSDGTKKLYQSPKTVVDQIAAVFGDVCDLLIHDSVHFGKRILAKLHQIARCRDSLFFDSL